MTESIGIQCLKKAVANNCSDIHFETNQPVYIRRHGEIRPVNNYPFSVDDMNELLKIVLEEKHQTMLKETGEVDFPYEIESVCRFRGNAYKEMDGYGISFRVIPNDIPNFRDLNLPEVLKKVCHKEKGIILVTGPTGSGKSTTLASMVDYINTNMHRKIITLEDPIEFMYTNKKSTITQRQIGVHTNSFSNGLRASLRQDPDVILVGEMRDLETIATAITAGETGHLVFATLHTMDATSTVQRMIDMFPSAQQGQIRSQLSTNLITVVAQRLLKRKDRTGRVGAFEVLINNPASQSLIRDGKTHQLLSNMQTYRNLGMITMEDALKDLLNNDLITEEEMNKFVNVWDE